MRPEIKERNEIIAQNGKLTREKRTKQVCKTFDLKIITNKLKPTQEEAIQRVFLEAKWYKNSIISAKDINSISTRKQTEIDVKNKDGEFETRDIKHLSSHVQQSILQQVKANIKTLSTQKKNGRKVGKLNFVKQVNSIELKQYGNTYKFNNSLSKVKIAGLPGWYRFRGGEQLNGYDIANARLVRKPSGYHLIVTAFIDKEKIQEETYQSGTAIGIDMGVKTHITLSNGEKINTLVGETERLKRLQKKSSRQIKGSNNYRKTLHLINKQYEKMSNKKDDAANKLVNKLLSNYETVYLQDENLSAWLKKGGWVKSGKRLHHSILGRVKSRLKAHERAVVLPKWVATTQLCRECGSLNKHDLDDRVYTCSCGYSFDRDVHAALNMISLGIDFKPPLPLE